MRIPRTAVLLCCCLFAASLFAQMAKPGLWETTTSMTFQRSPFANMPDMSKMPNSPFGGGAHTTQVCLTPQQIEKFGAPVNEQRDCQIVNIRKSSNGMKAEMVCAGSMNGRATIETTVLDASHSKTHVHFAGTMGGRGGQGMDVEWTSDSTSAYKGSDCGSVKPLPTK
ncbi:MAG: DUF3617 domain-containing protein [Acidobacteriota bacterium]|nr:DUF3617 domain-containing protein [Acidobacteriota bacterium]